MENFSLWTSIYSIAHLVLYVQPQRSLFHPFKLNPAYPAAGLVVREVARSARGVGVAMLSHGYVLISAQVGIATLYCGLVHGMHRSNALPRSVGIPGVWPAEDGGVGIASLILGIAVMYLWGDLHFYWTHRLLHTHWLYRAVHKVHHESFNPDPFSGEPAPKLYCALSHPSPNRRSLDALG